MMGPINDGLRRWRPDCCWLPVAGDLATARSLCAQAVGDGLSGLAAQFSDESALEVCIHVMRYTNRRLYFCMAAITTPIMQYLAQSWTWVTFN